jgi:hypothetical protein
MLKDWLPTAIAGGALAFIWADVRRVRLEWRRALYKEDGTPVYMMRDDCRAEQRDCQAGVCNKIAEVRAKLDAMDARREEQRNIIIEQLMRLSSRVEGLSSRLDEYIRNHK